MSRNTVSIWMTATFKYLLITGKVVPFATVSFSDTQNPKAVCEHIDSRWEALLLTRDNLTQTIQIQLSQKQKAFSKFSIFAFLKSIFNFQHFPKKDDSHSWCISGNSGSEIYS